MRDTKNLQKRPLLCTRAPPTHSPTSHSQQPFEHKKKDPTKNTHQAVTKGLVTKTALATDLVSNPLAKRECFQPTCWDEGCEGSPGGAETNFERCNRPLAKKAVAVQRQQAHNQNKDVAHYCPSCRAHLFYKARSGTAPLLTTLTLSSRGGEKTKLAGT